MASDGVGGYHGRAEPGLLRGRDQVPTHQVVPDGLGLGSPPLWLPGQGAVVRRKETKQLMNETDEFRNRDRVK